MAYSIHGHISWILETSSERPNDFSLIRKKPNEILQFTWKKLMLLKFKSNLTSKFMLKGSKAIKIMKKSKNRRRLTQVKVMFFAYKKTKNINIPWQQGNPRWKVLFLAVLYVLSIMLTYWLQNQLGENIYWSWAIYPKDCFFLGFSKEV